MSKGIIYVLSNPAMPDYIKVGKTTNLEKRLKDLYNTSVPLPFICERASEVDDMDLVEQKIHSAFGDSRINTKREFFELSADRIIDILELVEVQNVTPNFIAENEQEAKEVEKAITRSSRFNFKMLGINIGDELIFKKASPDGMPYTATVTENNKVIFRDEVMTASQSARIIIEELGYNWSTISGTDYWMYEDEILYARRKRMEEEGA